MSAINQSQLKPKKLEDGLSYKEYAIPLVRSFNDKREYRFIQLENQLCVLLISDPESDKSAAALDVHVGSQNDPKELPGLAHFCEHLLFMGNEKYPKENDYAEYLAENAGYSNAFTSYDHTNYYFEVATDHLEGALDRFAEFFISSHFSPSCTEREMKAVDSENNKNLQNDTWRLYQLQKSLSKPEHPFSFFATGSLETLLNTPKSKGIDTRDELLKFYGKYYSSNIMKLVVSGKESLDQLTKWVVPRFSRVKNLNIEPPIYFDTPYGEEHYKTKLSVVPVKDSRCIELHFDIPSQLPLYASKPAGILGHFIGHEGPGSILAFLKSKGWATSLYASGQNNTVAFCQFEIVVELTPSGLEHIEEVVTSIFEYIELLKKEGISEERFKELQFIYEANFRYKEKTEVSSYVSRLAGRMHRTCPPEEVLSCSSLLTKYDSKAIMETLNLLTPDRMRMTVISKKVQERKDLKKERWYGTEYAYEPLSPEFIKKLKSIKLNSDFSLPKPNPFVPTNFDLTKTSINDKFPVLLKNEDLGCVWYNRTRFEVPKVSTCIFFENPYCYASPRHFIYLELLKAILVENLNEFSYDAQMAGLGYELNVQYNGLSIVIHGYSHKLEVLLMEIVEHIINLTIPELVFNYCKETLDRSLQNSRMNAPIKHVSYYAFYSLCEKAWSDEDKASEVSSVTIKEIQDFARVFFARCYVQTLFCGNISPEDAVKLYSKVQDRFKFSKLYPAERIARRSVKLPGPKCSFVHQMTVPNPEALDSAIEFYIDLFEYHNLEERAYSELIGYLISEPAFNQLRTKEQLGYIVYGGDRALAAGGGIRIVVQSQRDPIYLESRIEAFLSSFLTLVESMSAEEFQSKVQGLISNKLKKEYNLAQCFELRWDAIGSKFYDFNEAEEVVSVLRKASKDKVINIIRENMVRDSPKRRKLSVHMTSQRVNEASKNPQIIDENEESQSEASMPNTQTSTEAEISKVVEPIIESNFTIDDCGENIPELTTWISKQILSPAPHPNFLLKVVENWESKDKSDLNPNSKL